jgi:dolichol-phosphate mannosyltransferase
MVTVEQPGQPGVSVVIPALNEEGNIANLVQETLDVVPAEVLTEIIVVDDGSTDATPRVLREMAQREPRLRVIRHGERCGQSTALRTGILAASSDVIATMDGDGQNDPRDIPNLLAELAVPHAAGPALVGGHRVTRKASGAKRFASRIANRVRGALLKDDSPDTGCGIKVFWRDVFIRLPFFTSMHRYLPMLFRVYGFETATHAVNDRPRLAGESKYTNFGRLMIAIYDLIGVIWLRRRTRIPQIDMDTGGSARRWPLDHGARAGVDGPPEVASPAGHTRQHEAAVNG